MSDPNDETQLTIVWHGNVSDAIQKWLTAGPHEPIVGTWEQFVKGN